MGLLLISTSEGYTFSLWPMSWIRFAACCRQDSSLSGSIPERRDGVVSSCSRVKNHLDDDPRHAAITVQQTNRERASHVFSHTSRTRSVTSLTYVSQCITSGNCSFIRHSNVIYSMSVIGRHQSMVDTNWVVWEILWKTKKKQRPDSPFKQWIIILHFVVNIHM